jgi:N-formylglutamate amidohydrolase
MASLYDTYHLSLDFAIATARASGTVLLVDVHGQSDNVQVAFRGTRNGQTATLNKLYASGGLLQRLIALGITVSPPTADGTENSSFNGGQIVVTHGASVGGAQAVQLEFGLNYRQSAWLNDTASKLADAIASWTNCASCR